MSFSSSSLTFLKLNFNFLIRKKHAFLTTQEKKNKSQSVFLFQGYTSFNIQTSKNIRQMSMPLFFHVNFYEMSIVLHML